MKKVFICEVGSSLKATAHVLQGSFLPEDRIPLSSVDFAIEDIAKKAGFFLEAINASRTEGIRFPSTEIANICSWLEQTMAAGFDQDEDEIEIVLIETGIFAGTTRDILYKIVFGSRFAPEADIRNCPVPLKRGSDEELAETLERIVSANAGEEISFDGSSDPKFSFEFKSFFETRGIEMWWPPETATTALFPSATV